MFKSMSFMMKQEDFESLADTGGLFPDSLLEVTMRLRFLWAMY
jgi:hypothetical protein